VRKTPIWPGNWSNFSVLQLYSHRNAWANLHILGQPNTFLARAQSYEGAITLGAKNFVVVRRSPKRSKKRPLTPLYLVDTM
jgi:hypothetical protein